MVSGFVSNLFLPSQHATIRRGSNDEVEVECITQASTFFTEVLPVKGDITPVLCKGRIAFSIDDAVVILGVAVIGQAW